MANIFLSSEQQGVVVFWIWKALAYPKRILLSFGCILVGFWLQYYLYSIFPGVILIVLGNLFLVVRGYDNRVNFGAYSPTTNWEKVAESKLLEVEQLVKKMRRWDRSTIDVSNGLGILTVIIVLLILLIVFMAGLSEENLVHQIIAIDAAILLLPHWLTGKRSILTQPNLLLKTKIIKRLLQDTKTRLQNHQVEFFMLLKGKNDTKIPDDVKFRVKIHQQHQDFLGFYGQIVTNMVGSTTYPYFYVVLVAKKGYGLQEAFDSYAAPRNCTKEYKVQGDVEVFVIRQTTTRTSGYHTKGKDIQRIFLEGLKIAEKAAVKLPTNDILTRK
jgi:hypothetical protein